MNERIEDRDGADSAPNPFGWGPRPVAADSDPLADLMGSPEPETEAATFGAPEPVFEENLAPEEQLCETLTEAPPRGPEPDAEPEVEVADAASPPTSPDEVATAAPVPVVDSRKLQALRLLLVGNVVMIAAMLALPHPLETRPEYQPSNAAAEPAAADGPAASAIVDPVLSGVEVREPQLGLPDDARYEQALRLAVEGRFDDASRTLEAFLAAHPDLNPALQRLVHAHLAYYLQKAGRVSEAIVHENAMRRLAGRASLPEELLQAARAAEQSGDGAAMRRAYAQFLLQREQLSPGMRALIQEAYLELGDAYRIEADAGQERSR